MIGKILCPVDGSNCSRQALQFALALARWRGAKVTALNVGPAVLLYPALVARVSPAVAPSPTRAERATQVARFIRPYITSHHPIDVILEEGDIAATITAVARTHASDVIVMGTHGRSGLAHLVFGSVAQKVVRTASCPVLVVGPAAHPLPWFRGFKRALCSTAADPQFASLLIEGAPPRITTLPPTESYDDIVLAVSERRPDLIVWNRDCDTIDILIRKACVPVLTVSAATATAGQVRRAGRIIR
jgi:nucleotide-binding universal stress UspA family protein